MPPTDTNSTPTPPPTGGFEPPKKLGFWAKLFGKKEQPAEQSPAAQPTSLTPEPQLDNTAPAEPALSEPSVTPPADTTTLQADATPVVEGAETTPPVAETPVVGEAPAPTVSSPAPAAPAEESPSVPPSSPNNQ